MKSQAPFSFIFSNTTHLQQINVKIYPSSKWSEDSNSQQLIHESQPITARQGLSHFNVMLF